MSFVFRVTGVLKAFSFSGYPRKFHHRVMYMYIAHSRVIFLFNLNSPFKLILRRFEIAFLMSRVRMLHFLQDWSWKFIQIHQNHIMALITCHHVLSLQVAMSIYFFSRPTQCFENVSYYLSGHSFFFHVWFLTGYHKFFIAEWVPTQWQMWCVITFNTRIKSEIIKAPEARKTLGKLNWAIQLSSFLASFFFLQWSKANCISI